MKKTLNINLAGYPFTIDEDAYNLLKDYLDTIRYAFETQEDTAELASDIESRVAEILIDNEKGGVRIVSLDEISKVIERIGKPSEFIDIEIEESSATSENKNKNEEEIKVEEEKITPPPYDPDKFSRNPFVRKRVYRDPQNSLLGGVCSGIAYYLHIDPTIVRLIAVLLFFLSASTVAIVYIILWIVIPEARTPYQRMQMMGKDPTVENIGKTVTENFQENTNTSDSSYSKSGINGLLSGAFSIFMKFLIILGLVIAIPILIALGAGLVGCIIAAFIIALIVFGGISSETYGVFDSTAEGLMVFYILLAVIGGIITIGVPLWLLLTKFRKRKDTNSTLLNRRAMVIVWLCGIALVAVFSVKAVKEAKQIPQKVWENLEEINITEEDLQDLGEVNINAEGVKIESKNGKIIKIDNEGVKVQTKETTNQDTTQISIMQENIIQDSIPIAEIRPDTIK